MTLDISVPEKLKTKENIIVLDTSIPNEVKKENRDTDEKDEFLSIWLRKKRIEWNIEQKELANCIGVKPVSICKIENNITKPSLKILKKLAHFFGTSIDEMVNLHSNDYFYTNHLLTKNKIKHIFNQDLDNEIKFIARYGLIEINGKIKNFLVLEEIKENILTQYCRDNINNSNSEFAGYPLLISLYIALNKTFWIGKADIWPTSGNNILALQFLDGRIVQLHISDLQSGCNLTCSYSKEVAEGINWWGNLNKNEARYIAENNYFRLFKEEENYWDE